ncbi:MAG: hypothetical protein QM775_33635 [Pirellulales bacterium]
MAANYAAAGWHTLFQLGGKQVMLPEELTPKWWDKKKQVTAKIKGGVSGGTGMGDALDELKKVFTKVETKFCFLSPAPNAVKNDVVLAETFIKSPEIKALHNELKTVRDLAKEQAVEMKKSMLTKKTGEVLEDIRDTADYLFVATNEQSLREALKNAISHWKQTISEKLTRLAQPAIDLAKKVPEKHDRVLKELDVKLKAFQENPNKPTDLQAKTVGTREDFGGSYRTFCRDMTQPLGNLVKFKTNGTPFNNFDDNKIATLLEDMGKISNTKGTEFMKGVDGKQAGEMMVEMRGWCKTYAGLVKDIAVASPTTTNVARRRSLLSSLLAGEESTSPL